MKRCLQKILRKSRQFFARMEQLLLEILALRHPIAAFVIVSVQEFDWRA